MTTRTRIIAIGNSQGVRLPKPLLEASGLAGEVELEAVAGQVVIRAARHAREGWDSAFSEMAGAGDDALLDPESKTTWSHTEWSW